MHSVRVDYESLLLTVQALFEHAGLAELDAKQASATLCYADGVGITTHGVENLERVYLDPLIRGEVDPTARRVVVRELGASALMDGGRGVGLVVGAEAIAHAVALARANGVGLVGVTNSTHFGAAGYYAKLAADEGLVGVAMSNCGAEQTVAPPLGRDRLIGTNPIAFAVRAERNPSFVLDMSTAVVAAGKVRLAARRGEPVPVGWLYDDAGRSVTSPDAFFAREARLPPLGGSVDGGAHKGFGLGLLVDLLCGGLTGADTGPAGHDGAAAGGTGHIFIAIDPGALRDPEAATEHVDHILDSVVDAPRLDRGPVRYAGWPEAETWAESLRSGVVIDRETAERVQMLCARAGAPQLRMLA